MKKFISLVLTCVLLCSSVCAFAKYELHYNGAVDNPKLKEIIKNASRNDSSALMYPPEEHPYLFVNEEYIVTLKANKDTDVYKDAYTHQLSLANNPLPAQPEGGYLSKTINNQLLARAFMYVMGEVDKKHAKDTVAFTIEYLKNAKTRETYSIYVYKDFGIAFEMGGLVYDWCYKVMTESQRSELAEIIKNLVCAPVQPARPDNTAAWSDINGYSVGQPLQNGSIAVTAIYDAYPDMYEKYMSRVQGSMAEISKIYGEAGAVTDGSIGYVREEYTYMVELMFNRMGYDTTEKYGYNLPTGYFLLYARTPYGSMIPYGDGSAPNTFGIIQNSSEVSNNMALLNVKFEDPYLKHYYERENSASTDIFTLLCKKGWHEAQTLDSLPLTFEAYSPRSALIAKTSWQEGKDSPAAMVFMNMNNRRSGDHDHADQGSFQIFYKGPLSMPGGGYWGEDWGKTHWRNYYTRTISKNCITVFDPNETYTYGNASAEANDGGQLGAKSKDGGYVIEDLKDHMANEREITKTVGTYIGPNEMTPAFSYIKGDLTKAYSSNKMAGYQRSMVFMDTYNKTYPGVFIVFDHVQSTVADYQKKFLLQAVAEPHIDGNKITIINKETNKEANGKLVNVTLIPEKVDIEAVGGIDTYISDGKEWPIIGADSAKKDATVGNELLNRSGWRAEIAASEAKKEDVFLNAMFVADADTTAPDLEFKKLTDGDMIGVATLDRQVMFKKDGKTLEKEFTLNVVDNNSGGKMLVLLTDVKTGKWNVKGNGKDIVLECKDYDNAVAFEAMPGEYTIAPVSADKEVTEFVWPEAEKEKIGDFAVKIGKSYQYLRQPSKLVDGVPYIPASVIEHGTDCQISLAGNTLTIKNTAGEEVKLTAGDKTVTKAYGANVETFVADYAPFVENGVFYFNFGGVDKALDMSAVYVASAKVLKITLGNSNVAAKPLVGVDESKVIAPIKIWASSDDGNPPENIVDRNIDTRWSSFQGDGEWCAFQMGEEAVEMSAVQIAWYNGDKRNWKFDIEISDDGQNWTKVLEKQKSAGKSKDVETFTLPAGTKAKYIRYLGHGEAVTNSYFNSVTEFLVLKK